MTSSPQIDPAGLNRLRDAEARLRLGRFQGSSDVVAAAVDLLVAGLEVPEVALLAGDDRVDDRELERDLDRALRALGLDPLSLEDAGLRLARAIANDVLAGSGNNQEMARAVWEIWLASGSPDNRLAQFAYVSDGFVDVPTYFPESALQEAAADFLAQAPGG